LASMRNGARAEASSLRSVQAIVAELSVRSARQRLPVLLPHLSKEVRRGLVPSQQGEEKGEGQGRSRGTRRMDGFTEGRGPLRRLRADLSPLRHGMGSPARRGQDAGPIRCPASCSFEGADPCGARTMRARLCELPPRARLRAEAKKSCLESPGPGSNRRPHLYDE